MGGEQLNKQARARAIDRLPAPYAVALRMRDAGAADGLIATALGIDLMALASLMEVAEAKLAAIQAQSGGATGDSG